MIIMKFGGSSVANREQIHKVFDIVRSRIDRGPLVVSSAHKGITDALVNAARSTVRGTVDLTPIERQRQIAAELGCADDLLEPLYEELRDLLRGISLVKELSPRSLDYVSSFGERMSVRAIADYFTRQGLPARAHDVWDLGFVTDSKFGSARPIDGWEQACREAVARLPNGEVAIVTGFVGKNRDGEITTVGRNGSDLTASLLGAALAAEEVQIWSDTDGVMTADPSVVKDSCNIPHMRFDEAAELAYFGSRVLHPSTLLPAMRCEIPVRVLNTNRPEHHGTVIEKSPVQNPNAATSIAYKERQSVLVLRTTRMFGQSGFLAGVFEIVGRHGIDVDVITTSEVSISLTSANRAQLEAAADELRAFGEVELQHGKTILVVVGQHLPERPGLGAGLLHSVAEAGVNVEMVSYGLDSINFTMLIDDADIGKTVKALHSMLFSKG
ncbi:MAG TPA: aspartate kinase [Enhygromyxa sp.]|nr:aspartate kinase [Enhygromyxa sp.]